MANRNIPALGEAVVPRLAAEIGVAAQKVQQDQTGWDFLLEFRREPGESASGINLPIDRWPLPWKCLIQVKTTTATKRSWTIRAKLESCLSLAMGILPAFFLLLQFGEGNDPDEAFLVPVDEALLARILKRARRAETQGEKPNRVSIELRGTRDNRIELTGAALKRAIGTHIGASMEEYAARKAEWTKKVGYEEMANRFTFHMAEDVDDGAPSGEWLVDLALGLRGPLAVKDARIEDVRFGIPARKPLAVIDKGWLEIPMKPLEAVVIKLESGGLTARATMDLFFPVGIAQRVDPAALKARLRNKFMDFVIRASSLDATISVPRFEERESLRRLYEPASLVLMVEEARTREASCKMSVWRKDHELLHRDLAVPPGFAPELLRLAAMIRDAWKVARYLEIEDQVEVSVAELLDQKERLEFFAALIEPARGAFKLEFFMDEDADTRPRRICAPIGTVVQLGDYRGAVVASCWGNLEPATSSEGAAARYQVVASERNPEARFVQQGIGTMPALAEMVHGVANKLNDSVTCLILDEYALGEKRDGP
jgi:hypothetical protein